MKVVNTKNRPLSAANSAIDLSDYGGIQISRPGPFGYDMLVNWSLLMMQQSSLNMIRLYPELMEARSAFNKSCAVGDTGLPAPDFTIHNSY